MQRRKVGITVISVIVIVCIIIVMAIQISTNSIMKEIADAFYCPDFYVEKNSYRPEEYHDDPNINYIIYEYDPNRANLYAHFNVTNQVGYLDQANINLKLRRVFAWHNFNSGTLWIYYTISVKDQAGKTITAWYPGVVKLTIQRENGKWEVIKIEEPV